MLHMGNDYVGMSLNQHKLVLKQDYVIIYKKVF